MNARKLKVLSPVLEDFEPYKQFCRCLLDAYAVIDHTGMVVVANPLFSQLVGMPNKQVINIKNLSDLLFMCVGESVLPVQEILSYKKPIRLDEISAQTHDERTVNLIIGVYPFQNSSRNESSGAFLVIRDVTAESELQDKYTTTAIKSITDPLTGLWTRSFLDETMTNSIASYKKLSDPEEKRSLCIAVFDIDLFKNVNDGFGHQCGDFVLQQVAALMKKCFRSTELVVRFGGEEFVVLFRETPLKFAILASERLRQEIETHTFNYEGRIIPITISGGVSTVDVEEKKAADKAFKRADEALYMAKKNGRNKIYFELDGDYSSFKKPAKARS